ncbi:MAG: phosphoenolpyruvate--protein phosphotransferase [Planctomycetota bacterium]|nr:phosphoenolpyruvate--protein phosphotransferase [Planctomycetota bacterium]
MRGEKNEQNPTHKVSAGDGIKREESLYLSVLRDTSAAVAESVEFRDALDQIVQIVAARLSFDVCSIYLCEEGSKSLVLTATYGLKMESVDEVRMNFGQGLTGLVAETERPVVTSDAPNHERYFYFPQTGEERFRTFAGVPLHLRGRFLGVLTVQTQRTYQFHPNEIFTLQALAGQVSSVVDVSLLVGRGLGGSSCLNGIGSSPGVGVGPAFLLRNERGAKLPRVVPSEGPAKERQKFEMAIAGSKDDFISRVDDLDRAGLSGEAVNVLQAQGKFIEDPVFLAQVYECIDTGTSAAVAVDQVLGKYVKIFESMDNEVFREKAHDVLDVRDQILINLGIPRRTAEMPNEPFVLVAEFLTPAQTASLAHELDPHQVLGIVTRHGSETSHASILARSLGIPAVVGVPELLSKIPKGERLLVDGSSGFVFVSPESDIEAQYRQRKQQEDNTFVQLIEQLEDLENQETTPQGSSVSVNLGMPTEIQSAKQNGARSVGLLRTEFYYMQQSAWPSHQDQVQFYRSVFRGFPEGSITVRLLDIGGDKHLPFLEPNKELNPYLGFRSIRFLLENPKVFREQVRAVLHAAREETSQVRFLVPMVTARWEMEATRQLFDEVCNEEGVSPKPSLGMMIEVPAVILQMDSYVELADFFSVGSNDLVQYLLAVDRNNEQVRNLYSPLHPAVIRALAQISKFCEENEFFFSICGEMAGVPLSSLALLSLGYRNFSVQPYAIPMVKYLLYHLHQDYLDHLGKYLLEQESSSEIQQRLRRGLREMTPFLAQI